MLMNYLRKFPESCIYFAFSLFPPPSAVIHGISIARNRTLEEFAVWSAFGRDANFLQYSP